MIEKYREISKRHLVEKIVLGIILIQGIIYVQMSFNAVSIVKSILDIKTGQFMIIEESLFILLRNVQIGLTLFSLALLSFDTYMDWKKIIQLDRLYLFLVEVLSLTLIVIYKPLAVQVSGFIDLHDLLREFRIYTELENRQTLIIAIAITILFIVFASFTVIDTIRSLKGSKRTLNFRPYRKDKNFNLSGQSKKIMTLVIIGSVVLSGTLMWSQFFRYTTVNVFDYYEVSFSGYSDKGTFSTFQTSLLRSLKEKPDRDNSENDLLDYITGIYLESDDKELLSNGDEITIRIKNRDESSNQKRIKPKYTKKDIVVYGLKVIPEKASEIAEIDKLTKRIDEETDRSMKYFSTDLGGNSTFTNQKIGYFFGKLEPDTYILSNGPTSGAVYGAVFRNERFSKNESHVIYYFVNIVGITGNEDGTKIEYVDEIKTKMYLVKTDEEALKALADDGYEKVGE